MSLGDCLTRRRDGHTAAARGHSVAVSTARRGLRVQRGDARRRGCSVAEARVAKGCSCPSATHAPARFSVGGEGDGGAVDRPEKDSPRASILAPFIASGASTSETGAARCDAGGDRVAARERGREPHWRAECSPGSPRCLSTRVPSPDGTGDLIYFYHGVEFRPTRAQFVGASRRHGFRADDARLGPEVTWEAVQEILSQLVDAGILARRPTP